MVKIDCLLCGETITLPEYVDKEQYDGEVRCENCLGRLRVTLAGSKVRKYKVVSEPKAFTYLDLVKMAQRESEKRKRAL